MESARNRIGNSVQKEEEELLVEEQEEKKLEILKRRICSHPLYDLLVEAHLDCLKVGEISNLDREQIIAQKQTMINKHNLGMSSQSELDLFMTPLVNALENFSNWVKYGKVRVKLPNMMSFLPDPSGEAYCVALGKLKEAMEEPQEKSMAFISDMHSQLRDLTLHAPPEPGPATSSSHCNIKSDADI